MTVQGEMKVMQFPSKYVQGRKAIELLPQYIDEMGARCLAVVTKSQYSHCEPYVFDAVKIAEAIMAVDRYGRL